MSVELWVGQDFGRMKEKEALERFLADMNDRFGESNDLFLILANYEIGRNQIDLTVLKKNAIIVIELKECTSPFKARQNGDWVTLTHEQYVIQTGNKNPYQQVSEYRRLWIDYLSQNCQRFLPSNKAKNLKCSHVSAFVAISPLVPKSSDINFPSLVSYWFKVIGLDELCNAVYKQETKEFNFTDVELRKIVRDELNLRLASIPSNILYAIIDRSDYIEEKTRNFVGRKFVFDAVNSFIQNHSRGYFFIYGDPGIGKSALSAKLVKECNYIHHFNIQAEGNNKAEHFLRNVCAQLIARYKLSHTFLPPEATKDANYLGKLLREVSQKLQNNEKCVIIIDALDEVDITGQSILTNPLYLPSNIPNNVYIIVTMRKNLNTVRVECEQDALFIEANTPDNLNDIHEFLLNSVKQSGIQQYISKQEIDNDLFIEHLQEKSEGNFIYLRYVLPEIERGFYHDLELKSLPKGLENYYEDHWKRMRKSNEQDWFSYKLPIVMALTIVEQPISIDLIAEFSQIDQYSRISSVLQEWSQFLHIIEKADEHGTVQKFYRMYHASFQDFVGRIQEVSEERVDLLAARQKIADTITKDLWGN